MNGSLNFPVGESRFLMCMCHSEMRVGEGETSIFWSLNILGLTLSQAGNQYSIYIQ